MKRRTFYHRTKSALKHGLKAIFKCLMERVENALTVAVVSLILLAVQHRMNHNQIWNETGSHFQDLVKTNELWKTQIEKLNNKQK